MLDKLEANAIGAHGHKCSKCKTTWAHDPRKTCTEELNKHSPILPELNEAICHDFDAQDVIYQKFAPFRMAYQTSHECPKCGKRETLCLALDRPDYYWDGKICLPWRDTISNGIGAGEKDQRGNGAMLRRDGRNDPAKRRQQAAKAR